MSGERKLSRLRAAYGQLVRLVPSTYRDRVGEAMLDTFDDLVHEHEELGHGAGFLFGIISNTALAVI